MTTKQSNRSLDELQKKIAEADTTDFGDLIRLCPNGPQELLRFANWSGLSFEGADLRGFDFTCARLRNCNFSGASIEGARFDQAEINETNLSAAKDWTAHLNSWKSSAKIPPDSHLPIGAVFRDAPFAPEMVVIPPGRFWMGSKDGEGRDSERPRHEVVIPDALAVGRFPVTFEEWDFAQASKDWKKLSGLKPRKSEDHGWGRGRWPVIDVSWIDSQAYLKWLSAKTGQAYRLLSEAEWEYACRAGKETAYCFGDGEKELGDYAWYAENSGGRTHLVGQKKANGFGLHDMYGNVWEWCKDNRHSAYGGRPDELKATGVVWATRGGGFRVLRGGSWLHDPQNLYLAYRSYIPGYHHYDIGLRVARMLPSES